MGGISNIPQAAVKAWVNFDGSGAISSNMTMRGNFNISSVFKNSIGDYTINLAAPLSNANYGVLFGISVDLAPTNGQSLFKVVSATASALRIQSYTIAGTLVDDLFGSVTFIQ